MAALVAAIHAFAGSVSRGCPDQVRARTQFDFATEKTRRSLHLAITRRLDARLVTFDRPMAAAARALGMAVVLP